MAQEEAESKWLVEMSKQNDLNVNIKKLKKVEIDLEFIDYGVIYLIIQTIQVHVTGHNSSVRNPPSWTMDVHVE